MKNQKLRVGVFGGRFGAQVHARALGALPGVEVAGVVSSSSDHARARALWEDGLDAVSIAVPPRDQPALIRQALSLGLHVMAEKPLATSGTEAADLAALAARTNERASNGLRTAVDFEFAHIPAFRHAGRLLRNQVLGPCERVDVMWSAPSWSQIHGAWNWKCDSSAGGGVLNLLGTHALHLVEQMVGPIISARGTLDDSASRRFAPKDEWENVAADSASLILHTRNNVEVRLSLSNRAQAPRVHRWVFHCQRGALMVRNDGADYVRGFSLHDLSGRANHPLDTSEAAPPWLRALDALPDGRVAAFARMAWMWLSGGDTPTFEHAARIQALVDAVRGEATPHRDVDLLAA